MQHNENELSFEGKNYYFLSKPEEMIVDKHVTIDRSSDEGSLWIYIHSLFIIS